MKNPIVTLVEALGRILRTIESSSIASVKTITSTLYRVEITNPVKKVEVKGTVTVGNQRKLEDQNRRLLEAVKKLPTKFPDIPAIPKYPDFPREMTVTNPVETVSVKDFAKVIEQLNALNKTVAKLPTRFPEPVKIPPYPKFPSFPQFPKIPAFPSEIRVSNPVDKVEITNFEVLLTALFNQDPERYLNVRLTDGEEFYKAVRQLTTTMSRERIPFKKADGTPHEALIDDQRRLVVTLGEYGINNERTIGNTTYTGNEDASGNWYIMRVVTGGGTEIRYASAINNEEISGYQAAWDNKTDLQYSTYSEAF